MNYLVPFRRAHMDRVIAEADFFKRLVHAVQRVKKSKVHRQRRRFDKAVDSPEARILRNYRPSYHVSGGTVTCECVRVIVNKKGKVHGLYEGKYFHHGRGEIATHRAKYGVRNNAPFEIWQN